jgi:ectoine hydroxylase-related dioxygenase (phytanoyl-CoA dioxygenase family)
MHPDQWDHKKSGLYTCVYFVDEVTAENGAIEFWPYTAHVPFDRRNPVARNEPSQIITGPAGTLLVFDSRIVHQSLPNGTEEKRDTLTWGLCSKRLRNAFRHYV